MDLNTYLETLSKKLILGENEDQKIRKSIEVLKKRIWGHYQIRLQDVILFGSYDRGSILPRKVDEESDVDILMLFKSADLKPQTFLSQLKDFAENNYASSEIKQVHPTITLELDHIRFEIVPGYRDRDIKIPAPKSKEIEWIDTDPIGFKEKLSVKNHNNYQLVTPIVKIFKYWNCLNGKPFSPYWLERCIVTTRYYDCSTYQDYFYSIISELSDYKLNAVQIEKLLIVVYHPSEAYGMVVQEIEVERGKECQLHFQFCVAL